MLHICTCDLCMNLLEQISVLIFVLLHLFVVTVIDFVGGWYSGWNFAEGLDLEQHFVVGLDLEHRFVVGLDLEQRFVVGLYLEQRFVEELDLEQRFVEELVGLWGC